MDNAARTQCSEWLFDPMQAHLHVIRATLSTVALFMWDARASLVLLSAVAALLLVELLYWIIVGSLRYYGYNTERNCVPYAFDARGPYHPQDPRVSCWFLKYFAALVALPFLANYEALPWLTAAAALDVVPLVVWAVGLACSCCMRCTGSDRPSAVSSTPPLSRATPAPSIVVV